MNAETKKMIRSKVDSYLKRAEEIKNMTENKPSKKQAVASDGTGRSSTKDNKGDDDGGDPDKKRMMQKIAGLLYYIYPLHIHTIIDLKL